MPRETFRVGIIAQSQAPVGQWATRVLRPVSLLCDLPVLAAGTQMSDLGGVRTVYLGDHALTLYSGETGHYRDNLGAAMASVWVSLAGDRVQLVTVDPYEGESLASDPDRIVEAVPMPDPVQRVVRAFIDAHHTDEVFIKRKRTPATVTTDPRAPRILPQDQKWGRE